MSKKLNVFRPEIKRAQEPQAPVTPPPQKTDDDIKLQLEFLAQQVKELKEMAIKPLAEANPPNEKLESLIQQLEKLVATTSARESKTEVMQATLKQRVPQNLERKTFTL